MPINRQAGFSPRHSLFRSIVLGAVYVLVGSSQLFLVSLGWWTLTEWLGNVYPETWGFLEGPGYQAIGLLLGFFFLVFNP